MEKHINMSVTPIQDRDAGLALAFIFLLLWLFFKLDVFIYIAMAVLLVAMIWARAMRPFALCWFGLAQIAGNFVSRILLSVIWLLMVAPVGFMRNMAGKDNLRLKEWQKDKNSVFCNRNHPYTADDLENPY